MLDLNITDEKVFSRTGLEEEKVYLQGLRTEPQERNLANGNTGKSW